MAPKPAEPEFSRPFAVERLGVASIAETLTATPAERMALATRMGLVSLDDFSATVTIARALSGLITVRGRLAADIVQVCVVTLEPFPSHVEDSFSVDFGDAPDDDSDEITIDIEEDPPEAIEGGVIDIGELVAQFLALALDPHPRSPGAALESEWLASDPADLSPFAVLKHLRSSD